MVARRLPVLGFLLVLLPADSPSASNPLFALAPIEVVADGFDELIGVVAAADGTVYVSDRGAGAVYRLLPPSPTPVVIGRAFRPAGLALDDTGRLLVAEEKGGRVIRLEPDGSWTAIATGLKTPRWLTAARNGSIYVAAQQSQAAADEGGDSGGHEILRIGPTARVTVVARGVHRLEALTATDDALLAAAAKGSEDGPEAHGVILRYPILGDGGLGGATVWAGTGLKTPVGLALDALDSVYASYKQVNLDTDRAKSGIAKVHPDLHLTDFASNLGDPRGLSFGPDDSLYLADGKAGRLLRFRAPPAPALAASPSFTAQPTIRVNGSTEPGARVDVVVIEAETSASTTADAAGAFSVSMSLATNVENTVGAVATPQAGNGLTSAVAAVKITHDDVAPALALAAPSNRGFLRQSVTVRAEAADATSGIASMGLSAGGHGLVSTLNPPAPAPAVTAIAAWPTTGGADGSHTILVTASDRAGNRATVSRTVLVDNTPPDTQITGGPSDVGSGSEATFTFAGTDNLTPAEGLVFAWRLDEAPFTAFSTATTATVPGVGEGAHTFEVKARDLAGNEDPTAARRSFTVSRLRLAITEPGNGATVPAGVLVVRGMIEAGGAEAGVTVNGVPAAVDGTGFAAAVPASPEVTSLTVLATGAGGGTASHSVAIVVTGASDAALVLRPIPQSGAAPLTVAFSLLGGTPFTRVELDVDGDGTIDFSGTRFEGQRFTFARPGLYVPRATITDSQGTRAVAGTIVQVADGAAVDAIFQARWTALRDALRGADVEAALRTVATGMRGRYRAGLQAIVGDLPAVASTLSDLRVVSLGDGLAEAVTIRLEEGRPEAYFVYFSPDEDGIWRILAM